MPNTTLSKTKLTYQDIEPLKSNKNNLYKKYRKSSILKTITLPYLEGGRPIPVKYSPKDVSWDCYGDPIK